ncbi:hypothetical protein Ait01nite_013780 [Actinoplanes italicus]|uniref:DUF6924 domain-containing protein n=1 Tax=Actinoplanes italicus TaxID=113567 RepID=A0A2T0KHA8_9ACTN|nr:hypothetical protein [Actinoplanes italicus]PRX22811.1 hypothetical protein CLV67_104339 [Actinoplanes italicus]GIE28333.1 hypothetical protein Ait01nite_013780 [Actinoplanes italicus]
MLSLPQPDDLTSLVLRVDFSDDAAWAGLEEAIGDDATWVDDPQWAGTTVQALVEADAAAEDDDKLTYVFVADATTMTDPERPLLVVDLCDEPGRTFRVPPPWFEDISANLALGNLDFEEFAEVTDADGTYRGMK